MFLLGGVSRSITDVPDFWGGIDSGSGSREGWPMECGLEIRIRSWAVPTGAEDEPRVVGWGQAWWSVDGQQEACFGRMESAWGDGDMAGVAGSWPWTLGIPGSSCLVALSGGCQILSHLALTGPSSWEGRG